MKTNRRSKRVKKTRRNRRSRRMQRGGGGGGEGGGDPMYNYLIEFCKKNCQNEYNVSFLQQPSRHGETPEQRRISCLTTCDHMYVLLKHYDDKTAVNGWYIFSTRHSEESVYYYLAHIIMTKDNPNALTHAAGLLPTLYRITPEMDINLMDEKLDKLPDLKKTYKTGRWYNKKSWKLIYNEATRLFEWTNQTDDKEIPQPFHIASPLKIGYEIATEVN